MAGEGTHEGRGDVHACMGSREIFVGGGRASAASQRGRAPPARGPPRQVCLLVLVCSHHYTVGQTLLSYPWVFFLSSFGLPPEILLQSGRL